MTKEQAYEKLELSVGTDLQVVRQKFNQMHNEFLMQIDGVSFNPAMKQKKEQQLEELKEAYTLLNESEGMDDSASLPRTERTFDHGGGETQSRSSEPKQSPLQSSIAEALTLFGLTKQQDATTIEQTIKQHLAELKEQFQSAKLQSVKDIYQQEIDKAQDAKGIVNDWIAERQQAEQRAEQERTQQAQAAVLPATEQSVGQNTATTAKKKSNVLVYIIPASILIGAGIYFSTRPTGEESPALDIHSVKDSMAWELAVEIGNDDAYTRYIDQYPEGIFVKIAKDSLARISAPAVTENTPTLTSQQMQDKEASEQLIAQQARIQELEREKSDHATQQAATRISAIPVPETVYVAGGTFRMGSAAYNSEKPVHSVTLRSYSIGKYEVTFAEYEAFCEATGRSKPGDEGWGRGHRPVINVNWSDAVAYCQWLSRQMGKTYRLPTEAEWEYAARGGNRSSGYTYSGGNNLGSVAWHSGNSGGKTQPVGGKSANELGIHDMSGNVYEWCRDWYERDYYVNSPESNPQGPSSGSDRILRGGYWDSSAVICRVTHRNGDEPSERYSDIGFRVVLEQ